MKVSFYLIIGLIAVVIVYSVTNKKTLLFQDERSFSIEQRMYMGPFRIKREMLFTSPHYESTKAKWGEGVRLAFRRPIKVGEGALLKNGATTFLIIIDSIDVSEIGYRWRNTTLTDLKEDRQQSEMQVGDTKLAWSYKSEGEAWLYADSYYRKAATNLYEMCYPITNLVSITRDGQVFCGGKWSKYPWE